MIDQVDGLGTGRTPHPVVYGVTVGRVHSSAGTVVADPAPGDLYHMTIHDRDISQFKGSGGQQSIPDTKRRGSLSDGHLTHAILSGKPEQALDFKAGQGFLVYDKNGCTIETSSDGSTMTFKNAAGTTIVIKDNLIYLGDPSKGGTFDFLMTASGPTINSKGQTG